jgi:hypothetical protein
LLALVPKLSVSHARALSKKAEKLNRKITIVTMTVIFAIGAIYQFRCARMRHDNGGIPGFLWRVELRGVLRPVRAARRKSD